MRLSGYAATKIGGVIFGISTLLRLQTEIPLARQTSEECASLVRVIMLPRATLLENTTQLQTRAFDANEDCVSAVAAHLADSSAMAVGAAAYALSVIGGDRAIAAVRAAVAGPAGERARASLPAATRTSAGESVLAAHYFVTAMEGPQLGPGWIPRHNAVLTLGVLRARESSELLRGLTGSTRSGTFVSQAAAAALSWMDRTPCALADTAGRTIDVALTLVVVVCGVPTFQNNAVSFLEQRFDGTPLRVWSNNDNSWTQRAADSGDNRIYPRLQFRTTLSPDSTRATISLHTSEGPGNLIVYRYLLRKSGSTWRVTAISFSGIA